MCLIFPGTHSIQNKLKSMYRLDQSEKCTKNLMLIENCLKLNILTTRYKCLSNTSSKLAKDPVSFDKIGFESAFAQIRHQFCHSNFMFTPFHNYLIFNVCYLFSYFHLFDLSSEFCHFSPLNATL